MVYCIIHFVLNDSRISGRLVGLYKTDKERSKSANEYGS